MPTDFKLDSTSHDLDLSGGTIELHDVNTRVVAQRVKIAILTKQGEWFANVLSGVPYYTEFFRSKNNKTLIDQFMVDYINDVEDVREVTDYQSTIGTDRVLRITVTITTFSGEIVTAMLEA